eukprot:3123952-Amphidinium_carterae.1
MEASVCTRGTCHSTDGPQCKTTSKNESREWPPNDGCSYRAPGDAGREQLCNIHQRFQRSTSGQHPSNERSRKLADLHKQLRRSAPGEWAPSDAGPEHICHSVSYTHLTLPTILLV